MSKWATEVWQSLTQSKQTYTALSKYFSEINADLPCLEIREISRLVRRLLRTYETPGGNEAVKTNKVCMYYLEFSGGLGVELRFLLSHGGCAGRPVGDSAISPVHLMRANHVVMR